MPAVGAFPMYGVPSETVLQIIIGQGGKIFHMENDERRGLSGEPIATMSQKIRGNSSGGY